MNELIGDDLERFSNLAYSFRCAPVTDGAQVAERFQALVDFVGECIADALWQDSCGREANDC